MEKSENLSLSTFLVVTFDIICLKKSVGSNYNVTPDTSNSADISTLFF